MCDSAPRLHPFPPEYLLRSRRPCLPVPFIEPPASSRHHPAARCGGARPGIHGYRANLKARSTRPDTATADPGDSFTGKNLNVDGFDPAISSKDKKEAASPVPSSFDFLELKRELEKEESNIGSPAKEELVPAEGLANDAQERGLRIGGRRQMIRRSNLLAKQVISIQSARSLGFVSQLWVDARSWVVVLVEVRPNLLSGEIEKFLLEDVSQVGDVILVQDENVMENELKMIGLDTMVGYSVITSGRRNVGKVRGYTFNINSGAVESIELDSFGISIIPSSLVTTYCLTIEDVIEVVADTVVVQEGATSRLQRLSKGILNTGKADISGDEMGEYSDFGTQRVRSVRSQSNQKIFGRRRFRQRMRDIEDDWELPMDY